MVCLVTNLKNSQCLSQRSYLFLHCEYQTGATFRVLEILLVTTGTPHVLQP